MSSGTHFLLAFTMRFTFALLLATLNAAFAIPLDDSAFIEKRAAVSSASFKDLVFYFQYASSAYVTTGCAKPNGNMLVSTINNAATDTQGFIARDDTRKEIVVSLRGSTSVQDFVTDSELTLVPFVSPGVNAPGALVRDHRAHWLPDCLELGGIQRDFDGEGASRGASRLSTCFERTLLGGALSALAGICSKISLAYVPDSRDIHPLGVEFWNFLDPAAAITTKSCAASGEDLTCSDSILSEGIDLAHLTYFNIFASTPFCN
ncbi:alpha/beta-hydrolase [Mycena vulgaris]|nr:alpha/beta-hydrolase [Mycena vulgaris]